MNDKFVALLEEILEENTASMVVHFGNALSGDAEAYKRLPKTHQNIIDQHKKNPDNLPDKTKAKRVATMISNIPGASENHKAALHDAIKTQGE